MYKYLIFSVLLACALAQENPDRYFLSPPLPPTAFQGQYYTVQFRVIGIDNPQFSFSNLPPFLTAYSDGTIEGTPDRLGSFVAKIKFESPGASGSRDIVFRVANSMAVGTAEEKVGRAGEKLFVVLNSGLTYSVGDKINITLSALNGKPQYTWNYINLPPQLSGNVFGYITGVFNIEGYYSFSASVSDSSGVTADSYLSINIQPKSVLKGTTNLIQALPSSKSPSAIYPWSTTLNRYKRSSKQLLYRCSLLSGQRRGCKEKSSWRDKTTPRLFWRSNSRPNRRALLSRILASAHNFKRNLRMQLQKLGKPLITLREHSL